MPAVVIAEQARPRVSIGHAMSLVGSLVRQLVALDAAAGSLGVPAGRIQHLVFVAASRQSAETFEKAICSIAFKSHLALGPGVEGKLHVQDEAATGSSEESGGVGAAMPTG